MLNHKPPTEIPVMETLTIANTLQAVRPYRSYTAPKHQIEIEQIEGLLEEIQYTNNLNDWETEFVQNIVPLANLTGKQRAKLTEIANKHLDWYKC